MKSAIFGFLFVFALGVCGWIYRDSLVFRDSPAASGRGVVFYDRLRTQPGFNLVQTSSSQGAQQCWLMNLQGEFVLTIRGTYCVILDGGGLVRSHNRELEQLGTNLERSWNQLAYVHHDIWPDPETGDVFVWASLEWQKVLGRFPSNVDVLIGFDKSGQKIYSWNVLEHADEVQKVFGPFIPSETAQNVHWEVSHFNALQLLPANILEKDHPEFRKGNILISTIQPSSGLAIIDRKTGHIVWSYLDSRSDNVHSPRLMADGSIIYFQNQQLDKDGAELGPYSRLVKIDPVAHQKLWMFQGKAPDTFFADFNGAVEILENGNYLVSHKSNGGAAFELTPNGRVVWEWVNSSADPLIRADIVRVLRVPIKQGEALISAAKAKDEFKRREFFNF